MGRAPTMLTTCDEQVIPGAGGGGANDREGNRVAAKLMHRIGRSPLQGSVTGQASEAQRRLALRTERRTRRQEGNGSPFGLICPCRAAGRSFGDASAMQEQIARRRNEIADLCCSHGIARDGLCFRHERRGLPGGM